MKKWKGNFILILLCLNMHVANADEPCKTQIDCLNKLAEYLSNLTGHLGYKPETPPATIENKMPDYDSLTKSEQSNIALYLGAIIPPIFSKTDAGATKFNIIPESTEGATFINKNSASIILATDDNGKNVAKMQMTGKIAASPSQPDPMMQSLLTMLSTQPSRCIAASKTSDKKCEEPELNAADLQKQNANLPESLVDFYNNDSNDNNQMVATVLNSNSLTTPFIVTDGAAIPIQTKPDNPFPLGGGKPPSIDVTAQQASTFIQYVAGTMIPLDLPSQSLLTLFSPKDKEYPAFKLALDNYILQIRTYVARLSVGLGNLYAILAKRMPQKDANGVQSSEALMEYKMATWRLFETTNEKTPQKWLDVINNASPASVQKEMAVLLAEINYQLYLSRQQQERLLLNNSILLLMNLTAVAPKSSALKSVAQGGGGAGDQ